MRKTGLVWPEIIVINIIAICLLDSLNSARAELRFEVSMEDWGPTCFLSGWEKINKKIFTILTKKSSLNAILLIESADLYSEARSTGALELAIRADDRTPLEFKVTPDDYFGGVSTSINLEQMGYIENADQISIRVSTLDLKSFDVKNYRYAIHSFLDCAL